MNFKMFSKILFLPIVIGSVLMIEDFSGETVVTDWRVTNDGVMGGKSAGSFKINRFMKFSVLIQEKLVLIT